jgi:hypothetical protein
MIGSLPLFAASRQQAATTVSDLASWWWTVARYEARELWRALPGPWWAKALLLAVTVAIPGPQDEVILLLVVAAFRRRQARKARENTSP